MSKAGKKVFKITDNIGLAFAGLVSDMQAMSREATAYANLFNLEKNRPIKVKAMAKLISNILFQRRMMPLLMETVVGGVDENGPAIFSMDPIGSLIPEKFVSAGSGAPIAMGLLEAKFNDEVDLVEGEKIAVEAIRSAVARDTTSGDGIDILLIKDNEIIEKTYQIKN
jgi:proteasome beta subunit